MSWSCCKCFKAESTDIKQLNYEHYTLHDVPTEVFVFERTLEELHLDSNRIRDLPRPLFHCHGLKVLSLSDNEVYSLPPAIASLINLQRLDISRNALNSIPDNLKGCKHLTYVDVSMNPLEKLPEGFTQLISLEELYLNDTYLDFLPANFGRLMRLRILELRENNLNTLPKSIARLVHLQRLDIGQNDFSDVPEVIGNLPNLTELWIDSNRIRSIPPFIGNLKKLVHLEASNNNIQFISAEIEHCGKIVDCSLTCNELKSLPETIGNLRELITLKIDDNQLSSLPNTIGNLSNLEELILSQNDLDSIPASVGLLRKLHILNVDDNMLEELPPEIGSCTRLRILSAHSNKLQHVPAELGHLSNLHVINLSENQLQNLPVSILNLGQLKALWLSNNQSTPLTTLQQEIDKHTGQMVCTNFMLPQCSQEINVTENNWMLQDVCTVTSNKSKPHISFATDADAGAPSRLMRAPTPYPKELRAMAKHARAMHHMKKSKGIEDDVPVMEEMVSQEPKDVLIKEAKVKKPSIDTVIVQASDHYGIEKNDNIDKQLESNRGLDSNSILQVYDDITYSTSLGEASSATVLGTGPVVREAKYIRKISTPYYDNIYWASEDRKQENILSNPEQTNQHPPPYHIAAAYSKKAAYFLQSNSMPPHRTYNYTSENSPCSPSRRVTDHGEMEPLELDTCSSVCKEDSIIRPQDRQINNDNIFNSHEKKLANHFSGCSSLPEEIPTEENISDEVSFLSLPLSKQIISAESLSVDRYMSANYFPEIKNSVIVSNDVGQRKMENFSEKALEEGKEGDENSVLSVSCKLADQIGYEQIQEHLNDVPYLQKPQTFTQDKPVVSGSVIAPTPQRPRSANPSSPDIKTSSFMTEHLHPCETRDFSRVPHFVPLSKLLDSEEIQNETNEFNSLNKVLPAVGEGSPELCVNSSSPRTFSSFILPPKEVNSDFPNDAPSLSSSVSNEDFSTTRMKATSGSELDFFDSVPTKIVNTYVNSQCNSSGQETSALINENNLPVDLQHLRNSIAKSEIENLDFAVEHASKMNDPLSVMKVNDSISAEQQSKTLSKWMFGLHKNATVFPVTIQKNSGLGFSIIGGMKTNNCERYENEIIVTKVHPNGPASKTIMPGDKILEVDGIDFTKLEHDEAVAVLKKTGNVVSMMISRQQL